MVNSRNWKALAGKQLSNYAEARSTGNVGGMDMDVVENSIHMAIRQKVLAIRKPDQGRGGEDQGAGVGGPSSRD